MIWPEPINITNRTVVRTALLSRFILIGLQWLANIAIDDHDAGVFNYPKDNASLSLADKAVNNVLGGLLRWDAQYFMHIAKYGYTYENTLAFFPGLPYTVWFLAVPLHLVLPLLTFDSVLLLTFTAVNIVFFVLAAVCLFELSQYVMPKEFAYKAAVLFCYNPASIFFIAPYTESMFSYLTFKSMLNSLKLFTKYSGHDRLQVNDLVYILPVALSSAVRSNGVINVGFVAYTIICVYLKRKGRVLVYLLVLIFVVVFCTLPLIIFQIYSYKCFCTDFKTDLPKEVVSHALLNNFVLPGTFSAHKQYWCFAKFPLAYSYVQSHYWYVGLMRYYEFKNIPHFVLAFPIFHIINFHTARILNRQSNIFTLKFTYNVFPNFYTFYSIPGLMVFTVHAMFLLYFGVFFMHVQVVTRMLCSASPVVYWFGAFSIAGATKLSHLLNFDAQRGAIPIFCAIYLIVGTVLFSNYLPWT